MVIIDAPTATPLASVLETVEILTTESSDQVGGELKGLKWGPQTGLKNRVGAQEGYKDPGSYIPIIFLSCLGPQSTPFAGVAGDPKGCW